MSTTTQELAATGEKQQSRESAPEPVTDGMRLAPLVDIQETNDEFVFIIDLPGVEAGAIDLTYDDGVLTIEAKVKPRQAATQRFVRQEYEVGDFRRAFNIGLEVNAEAIQAELKNGELKLRVPKAESARIRKIPVKAQS